MPQRQGRYKGVMRTSGGYLMGMCHRERVGIRGDEDIWGMPDRDVPQRQGRYQGMMRTSGGYLMGMCHRDRIGIRG